MAQLKPYEEKDISELNESDENVAVVGTVVSRDENGFVVDDGKKSLQVIMENKAENNSYVRVYGKVVSSGDDLILYGEAVQDISKIDKLLYRKVKKMIHG